MNDLHTSIETKNRRRRILALLTAVVLGSVLNGCSLSSELQTEEFYVDVPFSNDANTVIVEAMVNGQGPYRFLLDSGAPTLFSRTLTEELGLAGNGFAAINDVNRKKQATQLVTADSLSIGNFVVNKVDAAVLNNSELECLANGGILGANVLKHGAWSIDFVRQQLMASNDVSRLHTTQDDLEWVPFTTEFGKDEPWVEMTINGERISIEIDTGSNREIGLSTAIYTDVSTQDLSAAVEGRGFSSIGLAGRTMETSYRGYLSSIEFAGHDYSQLLAQVKSANTNRVGTSFFKGQRLIIDWTGNRVAVMGTPEQDNEERKTYGLSLLGDAEGAFVSYVWEGSSAEEAGLEPGDRVMAINGEPLTTAAPCYSVPRLQDYEGEIELRTVTDSHEKEVTLRKQVLLP